LQKKINRKIREGIVVSDKMEKTIVVAEKRMFKHPLYNKNVKTTKKYVVHDEMEQGAMGDKVRIVETRPLSKTKRWILIDVISKNMEI